MKVLVCGGRTYEDIDKVYEILSKIHKYNIITEIIEGGAKGADTLARSWTNEIERGIPCVTFEADWNTHGKSAGYIRNKEMLDYGPDLVVAFPGGKGTANMVKLAKEARVKVIKVANE